MTDSALGAFEFCKGFIRHRRGVRRILRTLSTAHGVRCVVRKRGVALCWMKDKLGLFGLGVGDVGEVETMVLW